MTRADDPKMIPRYTCIDTETLVLWAVFPGCRIAVKKWAVVCLDPKPSI